MFPEADQYQPDPVHERALLRPVAVHEETHLSDKLCVRENHGNILLMGY